METLEVKKEFGFVRKAECADDHLLQIGFAPLLGGSHFFWESTVLVLRTNLKNRLSSLRIFFQF
jgi:hypothetical protein